jgi:predicted SnoaL-like aldol condensation-catalyzing enzyme
MSNLERNKQVVVDYYTTAFAGNPERAVADHFGARYIQHNPEAQDGPDAFIGFVSGYGASTRTCNSRSSA